ncbi:type VII secretion protein EccCb [Nocardia sp. NPDC051463]|uniref:type VII secretion protein EccCb n=1 Tax=Nocardia sp. NPDC051463 TaxID=3154845 RepID=UPI00343D6A9B
MSSPTGRRLALFIANDTYHFEGLPRLYAPVSDAEQLRELLRDPEIGGFRPTELLTNESKAEIERSIERLFRGAEPEDVVLLYFSGHGLRTRQNLYLATSNTDPQLLSSTAVSSTFIRELIRDSAAAAKIILLDCCYSGAFLGADVVKSAPNIDDVGRELAAGDGICVLTASSAVETAEDGRAGSDQSAPLSVFTSALVKGIGTGLADNGSGLIGTHDLWTYVSADVRGRTSRQTPNHYGVFKDEVYIARVRRKYSAVLEVGDRVQLGALLGRLERDPVTGLRAENWWGTGRLKVPIGQERRSDGAPGETIWLDLAGADGNLLVVGRAGSGKSTLLRTLAGALALTHTAQEAQIYVLESSNRLGSMRALPHLVGVAGDDEPEQVQILLDTITREIRRRKKLYRDNSIDSPASLRAARSLLTDGPVADVFLLIDRWGDFREHIAEFDSRIKQVASAGPEYGVHVVATARDWSEAPDWLGDLLPAHVELRLHRPSESRINPERANRLPDGPGWALYGQRPFRIAMPDLRELQPDSVGLSDMTDGAAELVSRLVGERSAPSGLSRSLLDGEVDFADLFGIGSDDKVVLDEAWHAMAGRDRLRIPIGVTHTGETVELDLKQAAENGMGPHGLVVGAVGSGKSTLLKNIVAGLAVRHSPAVVNFLLISFKGEGAFDGLAGLPHVAALVDDLEADLSLVDRLAETVTGEVQRRQQLVRSAVNLNSLDESEQAGAADSPLRPVPQEPLPALLIIVDEFAELLSQKSGFAEALGMVARLGRSLGIHLLLATQRLDGPKLGAIESQLSYRIALRTFSANESRSVLGTSDAYQLPSTPGHGYLKHDSSDPIRFRAPYVVRPERDVHGAGTAGTVQRTLLDALAEQLRASAAPAHRIWLPPLTAPSTIDKLLLTSRASHGQLRVPVAVVDDPFAQRQDALTVALVGEHGNVAVVGGHGSGKSTALATFVMAIAATHSPDQVQFYILDFGGGGAFTDFAGLPHVGSIAARTDEDRVRRTIAELTALLHRREEFFTAESIVSMAEFRSRRADVDALPAGHLAADPILRESFGDVFLVVDGWRELFLQFEALETELSLLAVRGLQYGIHVILSATRWADIRAAVKDRIGTRVELRLNDLNDSDISRRAAALVPDIPGRGLLRGPAGAQHIFMALPRLDSETDVETLSVGVRSAGRQLRDAYPDRFAPEIRILPLRITRSEVLAAAEVSGIEQSWSRVVVGVRESDLQPLVLDFKSQPLFVAFADAGAGKTTLLRNITTGIVEQSTRGQVAILLIDPRRTMLEAVEGEYLSAYSTSSPDATAVLAQFADVIARRLPGPEVTPQQLRERSWWKGPEVFVIVDDYELVVSSSGNPLTPLIDLLPHANDCGLHLVVARRTAGAGRAMYDPVISRMRDLGADALVMSGSRDEGTLFGNVRPSPMPVGRGRFVTRPRDAELVQICELPE